MTEVKKNFAPTIISCIVVMVVVVTLFVNKEEVLVLAGIVIASINLY